MIIPLTNIKEKFSYDVLVQIFNYFYGNGNLTNYIIFFINERIQIFEIKILKDFDNKIVLLNFFTQSFWIFSL